MNSQVQPEAYCNLSFSPHELAGIVVDELILNGVRTFLYCPGSRNGALGFELGQRADQGEIQLHVRVDERSAGFVALGLTKGGSKPVAVVTTSGSAVANLLPAVTEANYARLPIVVLTANRPVEVLGTGTSQTLEQLTLLASQVRHVQQIAGGEGQPRQMNAALRSQVCRTVSIGRGRIHGRSGPVQIDLPLTSGLPPERPGPTFEPGRENRSPWILTPCLPRAETAAVSVDLSRLTLIVAGDGADLTGVPVDIPCMAEPTSGVTDRPQLHPWVLDYLEPAQVIVAGRPTLHRNVESLLSRSAVKVFQIGDGGDDWIYSAPNVDVLQTRFAYEGRVGADWSDDVARIDQLIKSTWSQALEGESYRETGLRTAERLVSCSRPGDILWFGASNPIRDVSLSSVIPDGVRVLSNRGVAGIDGNISSAVGAALANPESRVVALVGDLTFAYDASGLQFGRLERVPENLTIVVANDGGGGIFETLEQGHPKYREPEFGNTFERIYGTPQTVDVGSLCQAYNVDHRRCAVGELTAQLADTGSTSSISVVEVETTRSSLRHLHQQVRSRVERAVQGVGALA